MSAGCAAPFPADPDGTLQRVESGVLWVGVSPNETWSGFEDGEGVGREAQLVRGFADALAAEVRWREGGEEQLMEAVEAGELDLVIGGLTDATPWSTHAAMTRPYTESVDETGRTVRHVMAVPLGENAFLTELETYLEEAAP